jgi:hypothetical protein
VESSLDPAIRERYRIAGESTRQDGTLFKAHAAQSRNNCPRIIRDIVPAGLDTLGQRCFPTAALDGWFIFSPEDDSDHLVCSNIAHLGETG